jgi:hypothetical protein
LIGTYLGERSKENIYLENVINKTVELFPDKKGFISDLKTKFLQIENQHIEQILSDGTKLNLRQSIL